MYKQSKSGGPVGMGVKQSKSNSLNFGNDSHFEKCEPLIETQ